MAGRTRGVLLLTILCATVLVVIQGAPQEQQDPRAPPVGWYSSRSRDRSPYNQASPANPEAEAATAATDQDQEPSFGTREDYGSRDPTYSLRARARAVAQRQGLATGGRARRPQPGAAAAAYNREGYDPRPQPVYNPRPQPPRQDPPRQPVFGGYGVRPQPGYDPRSQPEPETPRQPDYNPRPQPDYNPRPQPDYNSRPQPDYNPRPQPEYNPRPQPDYNPRPQPDYNPRPQPDYNPRPQPDYNPRPQPDYNPRPQPRPEYPRQPVGGRYDPPQPGPQYPATDDLILQQGRQDRRQGRPTGDMVNLLPGGRYQGPGNLGGSGPKDFVIGDEGVLCAPTCRGHCIIRDTECNCVQNMTCFNEYKHRLDLPMADNLIQPPGCDAIQCKDPCGYKVQWPDGWCMCDIDPSCAARPPNNAYTKREADLDMLISQREAHMAELQRASRHSPKTKRQADDEDIDTEE